MQKYTKLNSDGQKKRSDKESDIKYNGNYFKVIDYKDYEIVSEKDMVVILPYLKDEGYILLRHEYIPTYQYHYRNSPDYNNVTNFITSISGGIEPNESIPNAIRRELYEEAGIVLSNMYQIDLDKSLFLNKGNCSKYHICFLELRYNDFKVVPPKGDGSKIEELSKTIKISIGDINEIRTHDLITDYLLTKFKLEYNIK